MKHLTIYRTVLIWVILCIIDATLAIDLNAFWDSFCYLKDYIPMGLIFYNICKYFNRGYYVSELDRNSLEVVVFVFLVRILMEILISLSIISSVCPISIVLYVLSLSIMFILKTNDKRTKR